jgi:protein gp37
MPSLNLQGIDWVIVGGETGPGARQIEESWIKAIRTMCVNAKIPFFFKGWGKTKPGRLLDERTWDEFPKQ